MDVIVVIIVIVSIIASVIKSANKAASKGRTPPQGMRPYFPPLSVDEPSGVNPPAEQKSPGSGSAVPDPYGGAYDAAALADMGAYETAAPETGGAYDAGVPDSRTSLEFGSIQEGTDAPVGSAEIMPDIKAVNVDLTELKMDLATGDASPAPGSAAGIPLFDRTGILKDRGEIVKAVIYSEILRPKFKYR
jgi:hypothetical protein